MIRKVFVYTFGNQTHKAAITAAAKLASKHNAQLTGLYVKPDIAAYAALYGNYQLNIANSYNETLAEHEEKANAEFDDLVANYEIKTDWHSVDQYEKKPSPSLYADFIFTSQPDHENSIIFNDNDFVDHLITSTGLPTVVIPKDWSADNFAEKPALGWKETREAAGAVRHTLELMRKAKDVEVVSISKRTDLDKELVEGIEISEYLSEHGITCRFSAVRMIESDHNPAEALIRHSLNNNRDLIIIGGYGHSRLRQIVLGGMTRELIKTSPIPLLLSH